MTSSLLNIKRDQTDQRWKLALSGELRLETESLRREFDRIVAQHPAVVRIELSELQFISSLGMGVLIRFYQSIRRHGGRLELSGIPSPILTALRRARLTVLLACICDARSEDAMFV